MSKLNRRVIGISLIVIITEGFLGLMAILSNNPLNAWLNLNGALILTIVAASVLLLLIWLIVWTFND